MNDKTALRRQFRSCRRDLSADVRARHDRSIRRTLASCGELAEGRVIAAYAAFDGEPDLAPWLTRQAGAGKQILLPVISTGESPRMDFVEWRQGEPESTNPFGIREPRGGEGRPIGEIDAILLPLVAWDSAGGRLGMGAGFYDRALAPFRNRPRPLRIGIAYNCQQSEQLPMDAWDIPLHAVVTESGWFTCPRQAVTMNPPSEHPE